MTSIGGSNGTAGLIASPKIGRGIKVADSLGVDRVTLGQISIPTEANPTGDYGLKVVSSDGATTIIDGTSNMFKIAATGTLNWPAAGAGAQTTNTTDVATGFTYAPMVTANVDFGGTLVLPAPQTGIALFDGHVVQHRDVSTQVVSVNQTRVTFTTSDGDAGGIGTSLAAGRFYILKEAAL